jgi:RNA polymerase sigma factor (sigma-70 family)
MSDHDLLRAYARDGSQAAFAELVGRHLNLVYSGARRIVRSPQLAEDAAQVVFTDLARQARTISSETPLVAWLHVVARRTSTDLVRRESRRQLRESAVAALADTATMPANDATWIDIEPLLDEAVESLEPADRTAILLRFLENKSLREVGDALGTSDDAAQKRVSRALDQLRAFFLTRGVAVTTAGLATNISANALLTAPAALATAITAAVLGGGATATAVGLGLAQKLLLTGGVAAAAGLAVFLVRPSPPPTLPVTNQGAVAAAPAAASAPLPSATVANPAARPPSRAELIDERIALLRKLLAELPAQNLPEIKMLAAAEWSEIAGQHELDTAADIRVALADLRAVGRKKFAAELQEALKRFTALSGGQLPADAAQLAALLALPADAEMLARYDLLRTGRIGEASEHLLREKPTSDLLLSVSLNSWNMKNNPEHPAAFGETEMDAVTRAAQSLKAAFGREGQEAGNFLAATMPALKSMVESMEQSMKEVYGSVGGADAFGEELKKAVRQFEAAHPQTPVTDLSQVLPFLPVADKLVAAAGPTLARIAYMADHQGQLPPNEEQLLRYLAGSPDFGAAFKAMKLKWDGDQLTLSYNFEWGGKKD